MEQINIEQKTPWTVKRVAALGNPEYEQKVGGTFASAWTTTPPPAPVQPVVPNPNAPIPWSASSILGDMGGMSDFEKQYYADRNTDYNQVINPQTEYDNLLKTKYA